jgi:hypothetical protein
VMVFFIVVLTVVNEGCTVEFEDGFIDGWWVGCKEGCVVGSLVE